MMFSAGTITSSKKTRAVPADDEYEVLIMFVVTCSVRGTSRTVIPFWERRGFGQAISICVNSQHERALRQDNSTSSRTSVLQGVTK